MSNADDHPGDDALETWFFLGKVCRNKNIKIHFMSIGDVTWSAVVVRLQTYMVFVRLVLCCNSSPTELRGD